MKVRLLADVTGTRDGAEWPPRGTVVELPDDEAAALIWSGIAVDAKIKDPEADAARATVEAAAVDTAPTKRGG